MEEKEKKELDLIDIIRTIFNYIRKIVFKIWDFTVWLLRFLFQAKWILVVAVIFGILYSFYKSRPEKLHYRGETEIRFNVYDAYFYRDLTNALGLYTMDENKSSLMQALDLTREEANNLLSIDSYFFIKKYLGAVKVDYSYEFEAIKRDTNDVRLNDRLLLVVTSRDTAIYSKLLKKIKSFYESNAIVQEENAIRMRHIDEKMRMINNEIQLLDSLRKKEYFKKESGSQAKLDQTILLSEKERRLYHDDILGLEYTMQGLQWEKEIKPGGVRFMSPFRVDPIPVNNLRKSLVKYVPVFFIFGCFVALGWKFRKKIYRFLSEK
ncbi:MAG: hypothetical protein LBR52_05395 [Prevotellaceae bacterium]|jgi:hypothetical protein|nr:hypothetical protein [Prevotellaceae bacterium]